MSEVSGFHADPVVPILLALVVLTLAAVSGGRLMTLIKQSPVRYQPSRRSLSESRAHNL